MKKIVIFLCLFAGSFLFANEAHDLATELHYLESYKQGVQTAKKEHKLMMLVVVEDGCHWCKKFKRTTLSDEGIKQELQGVVKVLVDRYANMPQKYESRFFPMVYFIDPKTQNILVKSYGYKTKALFRQEIQKATKKLNSLE
ncbi:thioredoxin fold domain-containing protein [Sulfurimonas sp.]|uniref:thioredoxin fold domain-containing protein n=1 Tax=Sulfurimonas sp. TaxID=2022749 RepID=UPI00261CDF8A|nr:thioredoxin fold domain-containing protein [Sulfurimonas sp.]